MKTSNAGFHKVSSVGQKNRAKHSYTATHAWPARSVLIKVAHVIERIGLAMVGGAGGLYVAVELMRTGNELFGSEWMVLLIMFYGAFGFYFGIDLPGRHAQGVTPTLPEKWQLRTVAVVLASAAGTFLAATAVFLSVGNMILDETAPNQFRVLVGCCWAIGSSFQIAAGAIARSNAIVDNDSEQLPLL